jgi:hypothetical protein
MVHPGSGCPVGYSYVSISASISDQDPPTTVSGQATRKIKLPRTLFRHAACSWIILYLLPCALSKSALMVMVTWPCTSCACSIQGCVRVRSNPLSSFISCGHSISFLPNSSLYLFKLEVYVPCYLLHGGYYLVHSAFLPVYQFNIPVVSFKGFVVRNIVLFVKNPIRIRMS